MGGALIPHRARKRRAAAFVAASCLVAAGCSLVVDTSGLSGGGSAGGSDAATDTIATNDGALDGTAVDGGDAGAKGCGRYADATFCQDFDDAATALTTPTWTASDVGEARGTITLVAEGASSAPNAARIALVSTVGDCNYLLLSKTFPGPVTSLITRVTVRVDVEDAFLVVVAKPTTAAGPSYRVIVGTERLAGGIFKLYGFVQKYLAGTFSEFAVQTMPFDTTPFGRNLEITVELTTAPTRSIVIREGARTLTLPAPPDLDLDGPRFDLGPYCRRTQATFTYDDVAAWVVR